VGNGTWITFEGIEGTGKSTQVERLAERARGLGRSVTVTREPGGTALGRGLRELLLRPTERQMDPLAELLLYAADRAQHLREVVIPALGRGDLVLCDRYLDATLAYQGYGRRLGVEVVLELHRRPPLDMRPHRTVLIDLDPELALHRARSRNAGAGLDVSEGRFEQERLDFHRRVRDGYRTLATAEPDRFRVIDGSGDEAAVESRIMAALGDLLGPTPVRSGDGDPA
jgi:dTMP kinase